CGFLVYAFYVLFKSSISEVSFLERLAFNQILFFTATLGFSPLTHPVVILIKLLVYSVLAAARNVHTSLFLYKLYHIIAALVTNH
ncbi:hypothetical protein, partial [Domibacillus robiginosus]|uniref:hypothetical protein n=1 Tax=Domibacillus robiginosus TaxID=1071054 RepID=UPI001C113C24